MNLPSIFRLAKNVSKYSEHRHKLGAVLVHHGSPISVGFNQCKSHPDAPHHGLHAEVQCLKSSGKDKLRGSTIYVYREKRNGMPGLARPCRFCQAELKKFGVKKILYSTDSFPYWEEEYI